MPTVKDFVSQLPPEERDVLANTLRAAIGQARNVLGAVENPAPREREPVTDLLISLKYAITELEAARNFLRQRA